MKKTLAALALAALLPATASAADFDYNYAEAAYSKADSDFTDGGLPYSGGQGFMVDGSYGFGEHWFAEALYRHNSFHQYLISKATPTTPSTSTSLTATPESLRLGGGFHTPIAGSVDLIAHLDYGFAHTHVESSRTHSSLPAGNDDGYVVGAGLRIHATDQLEVDVGIDHDDLGYGQQIVTVCTAKCVLFAEARQSGTENVLSAAGHYDFGPVIGGVEYRHSSFQGWRELLVSLRIDF
ncbi:MAG TPA: outer membrane beta-barrel protein [Gammaproteobacteria bacterium]